MSDPSTNRPSISPRPLILPSLFAPPSRPTATIHEKSTAVDNLTSVPLGPSPLPAPVTCGNPPPWTLPTYLRFPSTSAISTKRRMRPSITISHAGGGVGGDRQPRYALLLAIATLILFCLTFPLPPLLNTDTIHSYDHTTHTSSPHNSQHGNRLGLFELPIQKSVWMRYEHLPRPALLRLASFGRFASSSFPSSAAPSSTVRVGGVGVGETATWTTDDEHIDELSPLHDDLGIGISMRGLAHPKRPKGIIIPGSYEHRQKLHPRDLHRRADARRSRLPESYRRDMDAEEMARYTRRRGDQGRALAGVAAVVRPHKRMF